MRTAKEILANHAIFGDPNMEQAVINAMEEYARQQYFTDEEIKKVLEKNCSEFDDNIISHQQSDPV